MKIITCNRADAEERIALCETGTTAVISIRTFHDIKPTFKPKDPSKIIDILYLEFDDIERELKGYKPIEVEDAKAIADFVRKYEPLIDTLIVHCDAGFSRSAGVSAAISKYYFDTDEEYFDSGLYYPNTRCYSYVLKAFYEGE